MEILQTILFFLPILASAAFLPILVRKLGHGRPMTALGWLPLILSGSSMAAVLLGERGLTLGSTGLWSIAAVLGVLVFYSAPAAEISSQEDRA